MSTNATSDEGGKDEATAKMHSHSQQRFCNPLIVGIVAILVFLAVFVLQFSRILIAMGQVNHELPASAPHTPTSRPEAQQ